MKKYATYPGKIVSALSKDKGKRVKTFDEFLKKKKALGEKLELQYLKKLKKGVNIKVDVKGDKASGNVSFVADLNPGKNASGSVVYEGAKKEIDLTKIKKKYQAKSKHTHTIYFSGKGNSSKLMIASTPMEMPSYINEFKNEKEKAANFSSSLRIYNQIISDIDGFMKNTNPNKDVVVFELEIKNKIVLLSDTLAILEDKDKKTSNRIKECVIIFNKPKASFDQNEYYNQLQGQENGINKIFVADWKTNRDKFASEGRAKESDNEQQEFRNKIKNKLIRGYIDIMKLSSKDAEDKADFYLSDKAALHDPDQIAGGFADEIKRLGSLRINSSLGKQWTANSRIGKLDKHVEDESS